MQKSMWKLLSFKINDEDDDDGDSDDDDGDDDDDDSHLCVLITIVYCILLLPLGFWSSTLLISAEVHGHAVLLAARRTTVGGINWFTMIAVTCQLCITMLYLFVLMHSCCCVLLLFCIPFTISYWSRILPRIVFSFDLCYWTCQLCRETGIETWPGVLKC